MIEHVTSKEISERLRGAALRLETDALAGQGPWQQGLEDFGLKQERRALRAAVRNLTWCQLGPDELELRFFLRKGAYATSLLRELVLLQSAAQRCS